MPTGAAGALPLWLRGNEADPDSLLPTLPGTPSRTILPGHEVKTSHEENLIHDHMNFFGTESWLQYMPRLAGMRVSEGSQEYEPAPHWMGGPAPVDIKGPNGVTRTFKDETEATTGRALQMSADAAAAHAAAERVAAAERQVVALDPNPTLPVMLASSILKPARPGFGELVDEVMNPVYPPAGISGTDVNAIDVPVGAMLPLVKMSPRLAMKASDAVFKAANDRLDRDPDAKLQNADLNLSHHFYEFSMPPALLVLGPPDFKHHQKSSRSAPARENCAAFL